MWCTPGRRLAAGCGVMRASSFVEIDVIATPFGSGAARSAARKREPFVIWRSAAVQWPPGPQRPLDDEVPE